MCAENFLIDNGGTTDEDKHVVAKRGAKDVRRLLGREQHVGKRAHKKKTENATYIGKLLKQSQKVFHNFTL